MEDNKIKWLHVRLSEDEYDKLQKQFKNTTCRKLSEYIRNKIFEKHLTVYYRNKSLDDLMAELMPLRKSLYAVSNNFNQAVRKLNSMRPDDNPVPWLNAWERDRAVIIRQVENIKDHMEKFSEQWLRSSTPTHP